MQQLILSKQLKANATHGGDLNTGKRKIARPIATKRTMHLVLRSTKATGARSFLAKQHRAFVNESVRKLARENQIQIHEYANVGNHLHLLVRAKSRGGFKRFLRILTGKIAMRLGGGKKASAALGRFWDLLPYTRIVEWGRAYWHARRYVEQNRLEAEGVIPFQPRGKRQTLRSREKGAVRLTHGVNCANNFELDDAAFNR